MTAVVPIEKAKPAAETRPGRVGVLLVNLGTPDTADASGVRVYLREFLSDARVIENQGLLWKLVLNGIILRVRPGRKARDYLKIWNTERNESPLKTITRAQSDRLAAAVAASLLSVTKLKGAVTLVAPGVLPNDGKVIADERPVG